MSTTPPHIALMSAMPLPEVAGVPDWIHLLPAGPEVRTADGRGPYRVPSLQAVIAASGGKLPIDENHSIDLAAPRGESSPARGHIVELQARDDGLWGRVEWTGSGTALLADRAYLGISPAITHDKDLNVTGILRASLTNRPNLRGLTALHQENSMLLAARLAGMLGLDATTGDDALVIHITALHQTQATTTALQSSLSDIGVALGVAQDAAPADVVSAARIAGARGTAVETALQAQVTALQAQVSAQETARARDRAEAFVDGAKADHRIGITQDNRDHFITLHMADPAGTEKLINGFPKLPAVADPARDTVALQSDSRDLVGRARAYQTKQREAGQDIGWSDAVRAVSEGRQ